MYLLQGAEKCVSVITSHLKDIIWMIQSHCNHINYYCAYMLMLSVLASVFKRRHQ